MAFYRFRLLLDQAEKQSSDNIVCALVTGWTTNDKRIKVSDIKQTIKKALNEWLNTTDNKELKHPKWIPNLDIHDLEEVMDVSMIEILSKHGIHDIHVEIFNTEKDWKYDDSLTI